MKIGKFKRARVRAAANPILANIGDSFIENRRLNSDSERNNIRSLGAIIIELIEPIIYILDAGSTKLKDADK